MNPAVYQVDAQKKEMRGVNFSLSQKVTGISYAHNNTRSFGGHYPSSPTAEGIKWGLKTRAVTRNALPIDQVTTALAIDEVGKASFWVKNYGRRAGTGFVQTWVFPSALTSLSEILQIAEFGL